MKVCEKCGTSAPDAAKFCPKCGNTMQVDTTPAENTEPVKPENSVAAPSTEKSNTPEQKKPIDLSWFERSFWIFYVVSGLIAYLLMDASALYISVSTGFSVTLGIISILSSLIFLAVGIGRKLLTCKKDDEYKKKYALRDNICLAVSIVLFVALLLCNIAIFDSCSTINDMPDIPAMF